MTIAETARGAPPAASRHRGLRVGLAAIAVLELLDAMMRVQLLLPDYRHPADVVQALTAAYFVLAPVVSGAALLLAAIGRVRQAILALALLTLLTCLLQGIWLIGGSELPWAKGEPLLRLFIFPAAAIAAAALAAKNRRLAIAGLLVCMPTIYSWVPIVFFTIGVVIYGA